LLATLFNVSEGRRLRLAETASTAAGKAMFQMMGVFAEFERSMIRERVNAGIARAKDAGIHCGRPPWPKAPQCSGTAAHAPPETDRRDEHHEQPPMVLPKAIDGNVAGAGGPTLIKVHTRVMYFVLPVPPYVD